MILSSLCTTAPAGADPAAANQDQAARLAKVISDQGIRAGLLAEQFDQARLRLDDANDRLAAARAGIAGTEKQLDDARLQVRSIAVNSYVRGGMISQMGAVFPQMKSDLTVRDTYLASAGIGAKRAIEVFAKAHATYVAQHSYFMAAQEASAKALAQATAAQKTAAAADAREAALTSQPTGDLATLVAAAIQQRQADLAARYSDRASRSRTLGDQSNIAVAGAPPAQSNPTPIAPPGAGAGAGAGAAIAEALSQMGKSYAYGGSGPSVYDCSGLTAWAWGHAGHPLPHSSSAQYAQTQHVSISQLQPGDLVFYGSPPHHVGIYVGAAQMINALHAGTTVRYDSIYLEGDLIGGGRVA